MTSEHLAVSIKDGVAHLELNRPEVFNALSVPMTEALLQAAQDCEANPEVRVLLLTGRGRAFCAGGDVKAMAAAEDRPAMLTDLAASAHRAIAALSDLGKPIVGAVHGSVAGGGLGLSCVADVLIAAESTAFVSAYVGIGVSPDCSTSWFLPQIVGLRRALDLTLTNRRFSAAEGLAWGLVSEVVPDDELLAAGTAMAARLAAAPAQALGATRRLVRDAAASGLAHHLDREAASIAALSATPESIALIDAFGKRSK